MPRPLKRLALPLVALLVCLGIGECAARRSLGSKLDLAERLTPVARRFYHAKMFEPAYEGPMHYKGRPGAAIEIRDVTIRHNALGLRGPEVPEQKAPDEFRILVLGDSNVYGWGVRYEDTFGARLEALLNERENTRPVRVIGAGYPGYSTEDALGLFLHLRERLQADLVLLGWHHNDLQQLGMHVAADGILFDDGIPMVESWRPALHRSFLYRAVSFYVTTWQRASGELAMGSERNRAFGAEMLRRLAAAVRETGAPFLVLEIPVLEASEGSTKILPARYAGARWLEWLSVTCAEFELRLLPLVSSVGQCEASTLWVNEADHHPNALAHARFAEAIREYVVREGLVR